MERLHQAGKARAIGVSNFSCRKLEALLAVARVPPAVNQVECHPGWRQARLRELCRSTGVHFSAYSPLGSPASTRRAVLGHPVLTSIAGRLQRTPAQVALRGGLQMGQSVLPKSTDEVRIKENLDASDWSIPEALMAEFSEIKQVTLLRAEFGVHPVHGYKTLEDLWDGEI